MKREKLHIEKIHDLNSFKIKNNDMGGHVMHMEGRGRLNTVSWSGNVM
jgi:hypothetical protein